MAIIILQILAKFLIIAVIAGWALKGMLRFNTDAATLVGAVIAAFPALIDVAKNFGDTAAFVIMFSFIIACALYAIRHRDTIKE